MAIKTLAVKYRPLSFDDVVEQDEVKAILRQQLQTGTTKNAYLFVGSAGTGKTTCARIFANEINKFKGNPIEMDAASNNSVEDARDLIQQAKTKSIDSDYKVFIIDECHMLTNAAWNALLKLIEEPPAMSIFVFCTTDPQKIPNTILSRVQRYDFQRISTERIADRLKFILGSELNGTEHQYDTDAIRYIAKVAAGGMRDAITMLDKCLSYSTDLTLENVVKALGLVDYDKMIDLASKLLVSKDVEGVLDIIEDVHNAGKDLKQFMKTFTNFVLDLCKYSSTKKMQFLDTPAIHEDDVAYLSEQEDCVKLLSELIKLNAEIKWDTSPRGMIEATLLLQII